MVKSRPRLNLPESTLGRARDLADRPPIPMEERNAVIRLALTLGLDAIEVVFCFEGAAPACSVEGCTSPATLLLLDGGYRCDQCHEFDRGGQ